MGIYHVLPYVHCQLYLVKLILLIKKIYNCVTLRQCVMMLLYQSSAKMGSSKTVLHTYKIDKTILSFASHSKKVEVY